MIEPLYVESHPPKQLRTHMVLEVFEGGFVLGQIISAGTI